MVTKTYKAETMLEALQMVQSELGPDAIVLSAREAPASAAWGLWKRPGVEVVAAPAGPINAVLHRGSSAAAQTPTRPADSADREDPARIEWVTGPEPRKAPMPVYPPAPKTNHAWQPQRLSKEDAQEANRSQTVAATAPAPVRPDITESRRPTTSSDTMKALASVLEAVKNNTPAGAQSQADKTEKAPEMPLAMRKVRQHLLANGVDEAIVERISNVSMEMFSASSLQDEDVCRKYFQKLLEAELREQGPSTLTASKRVVCLVGMSGSGKTTTAAKLALFYSQKLGRKVAWVCADTLRTGAIAEGRAYCDALGLVFVAAYTPEELREAVAKASLAADLVLVDTPGYNPFQEDQMVELGHLLTEIPNRSTYLVASANMKDSDLNRAATALGIYGLDGVILTKLDETFSYGSVYNFARKSQLPLGYFASGKGAEGALQGGTASRLVSALFGKGWVK